MGTIASQITSLTIVYSTVYSGADQREHQSSASLAFVWGIHRGPVNSPHKWPVTRKMFPFDNVIMSNVLALMAVDEIYVCAIFLRIAVTLNIYKYSNSAVVPLKVARVACSVPCNALLTIRLYCSASITVYVISLWIGDDIMPGYAIKKKIHHIFRWVHLGDWWFHTKYCVAGMNNITVTIWNCDKTFTVQWRHSERDGVSNHGRFECLLNRFLSAYQRKHQRSATLVLVRGIHWWPVNSSHKGPVARKMFPFDNVIMWSPSSAS